MTANEKIFLKFQKLHFNQSTNQQGKIMLYLITGKPGAGKTLHLISMLKNDPDFKNRKVYIDGIEILDNEAIPNEAMPENCNGSNWHEWLPDGAILIIDECQRYWRPRPNGSAVPAAIQAMETHRHKGVDIYLITQMPTKIDKAIRELVEAHKHFSKSPLGIRRVMEWARVGNPETKADVSQALIKPYKLDKSCYDLYKSSVQHNEAKEPKSLVRFVIPLFVLGGIALLWYSLSSLFGDDSPFKDKPKQPKQSQQQAAQNQQQTSQQPTIPTPESMKSGVVGAFDNGKDKKAASEPATQDGQDTQNRQQTETLKESDFEPSIAGQPWTAPAYAHLSGKSQIKSMPYPVACVKTASSCTCYTEQGTIIDGMSKSECRKRMAKGLYNPYRTTEETLPKPIERSSYGDSGTVEQPKVMTLNSKAKEPDLINDGKVDLR